MSEKILSISEVHNYEPVFRDYGAYQGYVVTTSLRELYVLVDEGTCCCEDYDHLKSGDINPFIGATIKSIRYAAVDTYDDCKVLKEAAGEYVDVFDCAFVNIDTTEGLLQLAVYNHHNGYYGHDLLIKEVKNENK